MLEETLARVIRNETLWRLSDYDLFGTADPTADTERWSSEYQVGAADGSADINTTTPNALRVAITAAALAIAQYGVRGLWANTLRKFYDQVNVSVIVANPNVNPVWAGLAVSQGAAWNPNNYVAIYKRQSATVEQICVESNIAGAGVVTTVILATTDDTLAFRIERINTLWKLYYSLSQATVRTWVLAAEIEDPANAMTDTTSTYLCVYNPEDAAGQAIAADFTTFEHYEGLGNIGTSLAAILADLAVPGADAVANILERDVIGNKVDTHLYLPAGTASLMRYVKAILDTQGLSYRGVVTAVPGAGQFTIPTLAGLGAGRFLVGAGGGNSYYAHVLRDAGGAGAAPQGETASITAYDTATGTFTTQGFTAAVAAGDEVLILNPRVAEQGLSKGMYYHARVDAIPGANQFQDGKLAGLGAGKFIGGGVNSYYAFVLRDAGGAGAAPQGEIQAVTGYDTNTGIFTTAAFTVPVAVEDEVLIMNPMVAYILIGLPALLGYHVVPAADAGANALIRDVVGNKADTNLYLPDNTASAMRYLKALVGMQGLVYYGVVTDVPGANQFTIPTLAGLGAGKFSDATLPYFASVQRDAGGAGAVPQGQARQITAYDTATGTFTTAAFGAAVAIGDEILIMHHRVSYSIERVYGESNFVYNWFATLKGSLGILYEQASVAVNINAIVAGETDVLNLAVAATRYLVRHLRLKCADPGANTVTVRLYELVNGGPTVVDTFDITTLNFGTYHSLMDMFGLPHLAGDNLRVTVQASGGGPYAVTGQYSYAKNNN